MLVCSVRQLAKHVPASLYETGRIIMSLKLSLRDRSYAHLIKNTHIFEETIQLTKYCDRKLENGSHERNEHEKIQ